MNDHAVTIFQAAQAACATGATDWAALRAAMIRALKEAGNPEDLPKIAQRAAAPGRLDLIEMRDEIICEISRSARYRGNGNRARAEAIAADLCAYYRNRFSADHVMPQHDPDRGFHRMISNGSALIGGSGRPLSWNAVYQIITKE